MRYLLIFWGIPVGGCALWYILSYNDVAPASIILSRQFNDIVFSIYGQILGMETDTIRNLLIRAFIVDTLIIFAIFYFRPIKRIKEWWAARKEKMSQASPEGLPVQDTANDVNSVGYNELLPSLSENNLSKAP